MAAGLGEWPGFDLWSLRPSGERIAIEVKGRAGFGQGFLVYPNCIFFIFHTRDFTQIDQNAIRVFRVNQKALVIG
jgi:hypothetical protein